MRTLITLLRVPYLGRIGSTKLVLPKWHKYGTLNRVIRVGCVAHLWLNVKVKLWILFKLCFKTKIFSNKHGIYFEPI